MVLFIKYINQVIFFLTFIDDPQYYVLKQISLFNMDKNQIEEVMNESKLLSSLDSHYIVKYYDSFVENNNLNIVMEYCDSGDLSKYLQINQGIVKRISEDKIWKFFFEISLGISYLHSKKILHRDLKTLNIFLTKSDGVRIGDLGVAKVLTSDSLAHTFVGTPLYLSPEICEERAYNEKSDIWALGCILYEMCTFKHPFDASNQAALILKIMKGKYEPISREFSNDIKNLIEILLERNHFKRPEIFDVLTIPSKFINNYIQV
jgi:NIMA (never in mitosis gene a)-related kinase